MSDQTHSAEVTKYINSFQLEEGGPLDVTEVVTAGRELYWGTWYERKLLYICWRAGDPVASVAFSIDFAQYEVAQFCKYLEEAIGPWSPDSAMFIAVGNAAEGNERLLWNTDATLYRTFRDSGRIGNDQSKFT